MAEIAQRRPEYKLRRHVPVHISVLWEGGGSLNEGRSINSGDTCPASPSSGSRSRSLNEGRSINSGDTCRALASRRASPGALNEGRSINSGDTCSPNGMTVFG